MRCKIMYLPLLMLTCAAFNLMANSAVFDASQVNAQGLTQAQAKAVLVVALEHDKYQISLPGAFIEDLGCCGKGPLVNARYYDFSVGYDSPAAGATEVWGLFIVSKKTGDIWEVNLCKRVIFPELQKIQSEIMKKTTTTFADEKMQREGLGCPDE